MDRTLLARLSGGLLVLLAALQALSYPWMGLVRWTTVPLAGMPAVLERPALLMIGVLILIGLAGLFAAQRSRAGIVGVSLAVAGFVLNATVVLWAYSFAVAMRLAFVGSFLGDALTLFRFVFTVTIWPFVVADLLALGLFSGGLIYSSLVARRDGSLRWWWALLALGAGNLAALAVSFVLWYTDPSLFWTPVPPLDLAVAPLSVALDPLPALLWALLGIALLSARGARGGRGGWGVGQTEAATAQVQPSP